MKKYILFLFTSLFLFNCSATKIVTETVESHLKSQMKNPASFKIENISIELDTVPFFLNNDLLSLAQKYLDEVDKGEMYINRKDIGKAEKEKFADEFMSVLQNLNTMCHKDENNKPRINYIALVIYSGIGALGERISNRAIVIIDKKDTKKILGEYWVNSAFFNQYIAIRYCKDEEFNTNEIQDDTFDTDKLSRIEKFIFRY